MLLGLQTKEGPIMRVARGLLGCLGPALAKGRLSHTSLQHVSCLLQPLQLDFPGSLLSAFLGHTSKPGLM